MPTFAASAAGAWARVSTPSTVSEPVSVERTSRGTRPATARPNVLLPLPDGPTTSRHEPAGTVTVTPVSAGRSAPA